MRKEKTVEMQIQLRWLEHQLYDVAAQATDEERADLSMEISILRLRYARALRVTPWTATVALESGGERRRSMTRAAR